MKKKELTFFLKKFSVKPINMLGPEQNAHGRVKEQFMQKEMIENRGAEKGFSLMELMVVVSIIGVLAVIMIPNFRIFQAKARQSEAKQNLGLIYALEVAYFGDNSAYSTSTSAIGWSTPGTARYTYSIPTGAATFTAQASVLGQALGCQSGATSDVWTINDQSALTNTTALSGC